jgi:hypothetical protein
MNIDTIGSQDMTDETPAIQCDLTALPDGGRERVTALAGKLIPMARAVRDLPDGYALGYHDVSPELFSDIADFIALDRLCCPFLCHGLVSDPGRGTVWLELTGRQGAKEAIASDIAQLLSDDLAIAAGLHRPGRSMMPAGSSRSQSR